MVRGGLTDKDREWMKGEVQYKNQQTETTKRRRIRERVVQSLIDFELIARELPDEERKKIFEQLDEESESHCVEEVSYIIEFLYRGLNELALNPHSILESPEDHARDRFLAFRRSLVEGIDRGKANFDLLESREDPPDIITFASNAYLYEFPDFEEVRSELSNTKVWKEMAGDMGEIGDIADHDDVVDLLRLMARATVHEEVSRRHGAADKDIKQYRPL